MDQNTPAQEKPPEPEGASPGEAAPMELQPAPAAGKPGRQLASKTVNAIEFAAGFLGWFLITLVFFGQINDMETEIICGGVLFPVNVILLIVLLRKVRFAGWGMLAAVAANLIISIIVGQGDDALCFIPFYTNP